MKKRPGEKPTPQHSQPTFPIAQVSVADLIDRMDDEEIAKLLDEQLGEALEAYFNNWAEFTRAQQAVGAYRMNDRETIFRGSKDHDHPMYRGRWAQSNGGAAHVQIQLERALKAKDWQELIVLGGMMCVREMLYGRAVEATKPKQPEKAKAAKKPARKKPAAKRPAPQRKPAVTAAREGKIAGLKELVDQARPLFKKYPKLTREELIKAIGRRYERLCTFDELRTLCAGKTPTAHSLKKPAETKPAPTPRSATNPATAWPFSVGESVQDILDPKKPKRARRDPAAPAPAAPPNAAPAPAARIKPWPTRDAEGHYNGADADHMANFKSGGVQCEFYALQTEDGWTTGLYLRKPHDKDLRVPLSWKGPLAQDADTAIRDVTADLLADVKRVLKDAEGEHAELLAPQVPDLEKLRTWLLGFQVRGVERIEFLKKGGPLEMAA